MQCILNSFLLFIWAFALNKINFTVLALRETTECSTNGTSWIHEPVDNNCTNSEQYHCLPKFPLGGFVEGCLNVTEIKPGFCAIYNSFLKRPLIDDDTNCEQINGFKCPTDFYNSNQIYLYPSCLKINPDEMCYLADPNCPNITSTYSADNNEIMDSTISTGKSGTNDARKSVQPYWICSEMCIVSLLIWMELILFYR